MISSHIHHVFQVLLFNINSRAANHCKCFIFYFILSIVGMAHGHDTYITHSMDQNKKKAKMEGKIEKKVKKQGTKQAHQI